jgi:predicted dehydrogenase
MNKKNLVLICGSGSIAKRHALNLLKLGYKNLIFFKENKNFQPQFIKKFKIYYDIDVALKCKPKVVFICNATSKHLKYAINAAKARCHLFIEKPLSNKIDGLSDLEKIIRKNKIKLMVGYMMRFHPSIIKIKNFLGKKYLGNVFYARSSWSEYLPDWHPKENYKFSYAASNRLGGGSTLTLSHEIDLMNFFFGKIIKIDTCKSFKSKLNIKAEYSTNHQVEFKNGVIAQIHLDFMQKPYERKLEIVGEKKKLFFNYYKNEILILDRNGNKKQIVETNFKRNDMFISEIKFFLKNINKNIKMNCDIKYNIELLKNITN